MPLLLDKTGQVAGINIPVPERFVNGAQPSWLPLGVLFPLPWLSTMVSPTPHHHAFTKVEWNKEFSRKDAKSPREKLCVFAPLREQNLTLVKACPHHTVPRKTMPSKVKYKQQKTHPNNNKHNTPICAI